MSESIGARETANPPEDPVSPGPAIRLPPDARWTPGVARLAATNRLDRDALARQLGDAALLWHMQCRRETRVARKGRHRPGAKADARRLADPAPGFGDPYGLDRLRQQRNASKAAWAEQQHPDDTHDELVGISEQAAALLGRLRSLSVEAREALSLGTWRREGTNPITADVFARVEWDLPYVAEEALAGARKTQSAPRPKVGRPRLSSADRDLVGTLAAVWLRLTGDEAKAYYNDLMNPPATDQHWGAFRRHGVPAGDPKAFR